MNKKIIIISIVSGISLLLIGCLIGITYANKKNERVKIKEEVKKEIKEKEDNKEEIKINSKPNDKKIKIFQIIKIQLKMIIITKKIILLLMN